MIDIRRADARGQTKLNWLDSKHTFSFNQYNDPEHTNFRHLRVINEDIVAPGEGFAPHAHHDMEILTLVLSGALEHKDSLGNGSVIRPGDIQRLSAGTGIMHSEFNHSSTESVHFLQIWLFPRAKGLKPAYEQKSFDPSRMKNSLLCVASASDNDDAVKVHQDVDLYVTSLEAGKRVGHKMQRGGFGWIQVTAGLVNLNGIPLESGDGAAISGERSMEMVAVEPSQLILFDLT